MSCVVSQLSQVYRTRRATATGIDRLSCGYDKSMEKPPDPSPMLKEDIDAAFKKYYPAAANASGAGYIVLDENHRILRIDPIAQAILGATELQCLGESLKLFMPPETTIGQHDLLVDGAMVAFTRDSEAIPTSMGKGEDGKTKARNVLRGDGSSVSVKLDIALLPVGDKKYPFAVITRATESIDIDLLEGKEAVIKDVKIRLAQQASSTFRHELFAWSSAFQVIFGTSRLGKIASVITPISLLLVLVYVSLVAFKVIPPPDFSTTQIIDLRGDGATAPPKPRGSGPAPARNSPNPQ